MSKYNIGKDIGELFARVKALEEIMMRCTCGKNGVEEFVIRSLTTEELSRAEKDEDKGKFCIYSVVGFVGDPCPNINIGDHICVSPCPPCPNISRLKLINAQGGTMCTVIVGWASQGRCRTCPPGGHRFTWA